MVLSSPCVVETEASAKKSLSASGRFVRANGATDVFGVSQTRSADLAMPTDDDTQRMRDAQRLCAPASIVLLALSVVLVAVCTGCGRVVVARRGLVVA